MTFRCLDSITPANLPAGADAYLGYADGRWPTGPAITARFGQTARIIVLAVSAATDAEGCDCETGDLAVDQLPGWMRRQLGRGVWRPILYIGAANAMAALNVLAAGGIGRQQYRLLTAHYGAGKHICGRTTCGYPQADGTQWRDNAPGSAGTLIDESLLAGDFFAQAAQPGRPLEAPVLLNKGKDAKTPIALPDGAKTVRFFSNNDATIGVDLRGPGGVEDVRLTYLSAHEVAIPAGCHAIVVHRVDDGSNDVSAAVSS